MPLFVLEFQRPNGELSPDWFRDDLIDEMLDYQIMTAETKTPDEELQRAYVYGSMYAALVRDLMIEPALQREGDAWEEFSTKQLAFFRAESERHMNIFNLGVTGRNALRYSRVRNLVPTF